MSSEVPESDRRFKLTVFGGMCDGDDMLGGEVGLNNVYISVYGKWVSGPSPSKLPVGGSCIREYNMGGTKQQYKIIRTA